MKIALTLLLLCYSVAIKAQGIHATNRYVEICIPETGGCGISVIDTYTGNVRLALKGPIEVPSDIGIEVQIVDQAQYDYMKKYAVANLLEPLEPKWKRELTPEEEAIYDEQVENTLKCLVGVSLCIVSWIEVAETFGASAGIAYGTCFLTAMECKAARRANLALEERRKELKKKIKEQREANGLPTTTPSAQPGSGSESGSPSRPHNPVPIPPQPTITINPGKTPVISGRETPPGGGEPKPIWPKEESKL